jgi:hypothetical protein
LNTSKEHKVNKETYLFYTYDSRGNDRIIPVRAHTKDEAFELFDRVYGSDTPVDFVVRKEEQYPD